MHVLTCVAAPRCCTTARTTEQASVCGSRSTSAVAGADADAQLRSLEAMEFYRPSVEGGLEHVHTEAALAPRSGPGELR
jgi:hypothetical protein